MRRVLEVEHASPSCLYVRGRGARAIVETAIGAAPVWGSRARAWIAAPHRMADIAAAAESRGMEVVVIEAGAEHLDPAGGSW